MPVIKHESFLLRFEKEKVPERWDLSLTFLERPPAIAPPPEAGEEALTTSLTKKTQANPPSPSCLTILNLLSLIHTSPPPLTAPYNAFSPEKEHPISHSFSPFLSSVFTCVWKSAAEWILDSLSLVSCSLFGKRNELIFTCLYVHFSFYLSSKTMNLFSNIHRIFNIFLDINIFG